LPSENKKRIKVTRYRTYTTSHTIYIANKSLVHLT